MHLVIIFNSIPLSDSKRDEATTVQDINMFLISKNIPPDLKITVIKWNIQKNCITFTKTDQTTAVVILLVSKLSNVIVLSYNGQVREDKKWFKIKI